MVDTFLRVLPHLETAKVRVQQIQYLLIVDFQKGTLDFELHIGVPLLLLDLLKQIFKGSRQQSFLLLTIIPTNRIRLARPCLPICEYSCIIPLAYNILPVSRRDIKALPTVRISVLECRTRFRHNRNKNYVFSRSYSRPTKT